MIILSALSSLMLIVCGGYFALKFRLFYLRHPIKTLERMPLSSGGRQMMLSLGGTVGVGNISGVAVAISIGGSGAVFWMLVGSFFAMALKCAEITLAMFERKGATFYIKRALGNIASALFAILLVADCIMMGGIIQVSAIADAFDTAFGISPVVTGIFACLAVGATFMFNFDLFRLSAYIVPLMSIGYALAALVIVFVYANDIPKVVLDIFASAFDFNSALGGGIGFLFTPAFSQGIIKGLFSNEAGCGTASFSHSASKEKDPARQGLFGILEVFVDTSIMCTLTALVILLTLGENIGEGGISVCAKAFSAVYGEKAAAVLAIFIFLFAYSAIISFGYYGTKCLPQRIKNPFLILYSLSLLLGAVAAPMLVWELADAVICLMLLINTSAIMFYREKIVKAHHDHIGKYSQSASKTRSRSNVFTKNEIPISENFKNSGFIEYSRQNKAK